MPEKRSAELGQGLVPETKKQTETTEIRDPLEAKRELFKRIEKEIGRLNSVERSRLLDLVFGNSIDDGLNLADKLGLNSFQKSLYLLDSDVEGKQVELRNRIAQFLVTDVNSDDIEDDNRRAFSQLTRAVSDDLADISSNFMLAGRTSQVFENFSPEAKVLAGEIEDYYSKFLKTRSVAEDRRNITFDRHRKPERYKKGYEAGGVPLAEQALRAWELEHGGYYYAAPIREAVVKRAMEYFSIPEDQALALVENTPALNSSVSVISEEGADFWFKQVNLDPKNAEQLKRRNKYQSTGLVNNLRMQEAREGLLDKLEEEIKKAGRDPKDFILRLDPESGKYKLVLDQQQNPESEKKEGKAELNINDFEHFELPVLNPKERVLNDYIINENGAVALATYDKSAQESKQGYKFPNQGYFEMSSGKEQVHFLAPLEDGFLYARETVSGTFELIDTSGKTWERDLSKIPEMKELGDDRRVCIGSVLGFSVVCIFPEGRQIKIAGAVEVVSNSNDSSELVIRKTSGGIGSLYDTDLNQIDKDIVWAKYVDGVLVYQKEAGMLSNVVFGTEYVSKEYQSIVTSGKHQGKWCVIGRVGDGYYFETEGKRFKIKGTSGIEIDYGFITESEIVLGGYDNVKSRCLRLQNEILVEDLNVADVHFGSGEKKYVIETLKSPAGHMRINLVEQGFVSPPFPEEDPDYMNRDYLSDGRFYFYSENTGIFYISNPDTKQFETLSIGQVFVDTLMVYEHQGRVLLYYEDIDNYNLIDSLGNKILTTEEPFRVTVDKSNKSIAIIGLADKGWDLRVLRGDKTPKSLDVVGLDDKDGSMQLTDEQNKILDLLNLLNQPDVVSIKSYFTSQNAAKGQSFRERVREVVSASPAIARNLTRALSRAPQAFLDTVAGVRADLSEDHVRRIVFNLFPELKNKNNYPNYDNGKRSPEMDRLSSLLRLGSTEFKDGDPEEGGVEVLRFREEIHEVIASQVYGEYNADTRSWSSAVFPVTPDLDEPVKEYTATIPGVKGLEEVNLPLLLGAAVVPDRIRGINSKGQELVLDSDSNIVGQTWVALKPEVESLVYTQRRSELPATPENLSKDQYQAFRKRWNNSFGDGMSRKVADLPPEIRLFVDSLASLEPVEKLVAIEGYSRKIGHYDFKNKRVQSRKDGVSIEERFAVMSERMMEIQGDMEYTDLIEKSYAGVCADFNMLTVAMLRHAGFVSGLIEGFRPSGKVVTTEHLHGIAYAVWPSGQHEYKIIPVDGTPGGVTAEEQRLLQEFQMLSISERIKIREERFKDRIVVEQKRFEEIERVLRENDIERIKMLSNGELEKVLNVVLQNTVKETHLAGLKAVLDVAAYSRNQISGSDFEDLEAKVAFMRQAESAVRNTRNQESSQSSDKPAGEQMLSMVLEYSHRFVRRGIAKNPHEAYQVLGKILDAAKPFLKDEEQRAAYALVNYLDAKKVQ
jgi:hypothetical protein